MTNSKEIEALQNTLVNRLRSGVLPDGFQVTWKCPCKTPCKDPEQDKCPVWEKLYRIEYPGTKEPGSDNTRRHISVKEVK